MNATTLDTNHNFLGRLAQPWAASRPGTPRPVSRPNTKPRPTAEPALWQVTLAEAGDSLTERLLFATVTAAAAASLGWLVLLTHQFFLSWDNFALWVRAALQ